MPKKTLRILLTGKVQDVNMRYMAYKKAVSLDLSGNIKNMPDGSVEIHASGDALKNSSRGMPFPPTTIRRALG